MCLYERVADCICGHIDDVWIFFLERNHRSGYLREYDLISIHGRWLKKYNY